MFYIVGSTGIVSKILQKIINKKNYILISSKKKIQVFTVKYLIIKKLTKNGLITLKKTIL